MENGKDGFNMKTQHYIFGGIALFALIVIVFLLMKKQDDVPDPGDDVDDDQLSYSKSRYTTIAHAIYQAFGWSTLGDDEETIYRNLRFLQNENDWNYLLSIYQDATGDDRDLVSHLIHNLDSDEIAIVNSILAKFNQSI